MNSPRQNRIALYQERPYLRKRLEQLRKCVSRGWLLLYRGGECFSEYLYYLTGLDTFNTLAFISLESDKAYIITNPIEYPTIRNVFDAQVLSAPQDALLETLLPLIGQLAPSPLYCEYTLSSHTPLPAEIIDVIRKTYPDIAISPLPEALHKMRLVKDTYETGLIRKGTKIIESFFEELSPLIHPGMMEREIAAEIQQYLTKAGFNRFYDIFVASGPNSAIPFYRKNSGALPEDSVVLIDICAAIDYYVCDMTRTFPTSGHFTPRQAFLYDSVLEAYREAKALVTPGTTLSLLTDSAKSVFTQKGLESYYLNKIGHFVGLAPDDPGCPDTPLKRGMAITIEPGVYLPEEGLGIRIEDTIIV